jgi:hypothetical protein
MPSGRPTSPASSFTSMEAGRELTVPVRPGKTSHHGALLFRIDYKYRQPPGRRDRMSDRRPTSTHGLHEFDRLMRMANSQAQPLKPPSPEFLATQKRFESKP